MKRYVYIISCLAILFVHNGFAQCGAGIVNPSSRVVCEGDTYQFTVSGAQGSLQWQQNTVDTLSLVDWTNIAGATNASFTSPPVFGTTWFRVVSDTTGCATQTTLTSVVHKATQPSVTLIPGSATTATVEWAPYGANQYDLIWYPTAAGSVSGAQSPYLITGLFPNANLCVGIYSNFSCPNVTSSATVCMNGPCAPAPPVYLSGTPTANSANVNWSTQWMIVKYRVRLKNMATGQTSLHFVNAPDTTKAFTGLAPNTLYKVQVRSQCSTDGSGLSPWSAPLYFTTLPGTAANCVAPQNFSTFLFSNSSAMISWTFVNGSNGYQLRYRPVGTTIWNPIVINNGIAGGTQLSGLQPNTSYEYQVRTKCTVNPLTWSNYSPLQYFSTPLRLGEDELKPLVQLLPNPSNGTVSFNPNGLVGTVSIFDAVGRIIFHQAVSGETELTNLPNGFLTYRFVETDGKMVNGKFVVAR